MKKRKNIAIPMILAATIAAVRSEERRVERV